MPLSSTHGPSLVHSGLPVVGSTHTLGLPRHAEPAGQPSSHGSGTQSGAPVLEPPVASGPVEVGGPPELWPPVLVVVSVVEVEAGDGAPSGVGAGATGPQASERMRDARAWRSTPGGYSG